MLGPKARGEALSIGGSLLTWHTPSPVQSSQTGHPLLPDANPKHQPRSGRCVAGLFALCSAICKICYLPSHSHIGCTTTASDRVQNARVSRTFSFAPTSGLGFRKAKDQPPFAVPTAVGSCDRRVFEKRYASEAAEIFGIFGRP